ncbi:hypothetical protein XELAEV_18047540mg [Xenopus laevis]|uniref:Uncharacterized protein n=1 Tax=Xenopus laevis TaxID=8355 RepID=A0A974BV25_XENLA|nr:hypothetical protein XELAEV_18047540mg [Xenopus laevis]
MLNKFLQPCILYIFVHIFFPPFSTFSPLAISLYCAHSDVGFYTFVNSPSQMEKVVHLDKQYLQKCVFHSVTDFVTLCDLCL